MRSICSRYCPAGYSDEGLQSTVWGINYSAWYAYITCRFPSLASSAAAAVSRMQPVKKKKHLHQSWCHPHSVACIESSPVGESQGYCSISRHSVEISLVLRGGLIAGCMGWRTLIADSRWPTSMLKDRQSPRLTDDYLFLTILVCSYLAIQNTVLYITFADTALLSRSSSATRSKWVHQVSRLWGHGLRAVKVTTSL